MIHIRIDNKLLNKDAEFLCGIKGALPEGDKYFLASESMAYRLADCPGCNPNPECRGTPISELSGRRGTQVMKNLIASRGRGGTSDHHN